MTQIRATNLGPFSCLFGLAFLALMGWLLYHFYLFLWYPAPIFFALALIIDYKIPLAWGKRLLLIFQKNPIAGLISMAFAAVFFPFTALGMFFNTVAKSRIERAQETYFGGQNLFTKKQNPPTQTDEYVDFEELESKPKKETPNSKSTSYDNFFEEK